MAVLSALRRTPGTLQRNPVIFVPVLALVLVQLPQLLAEFVNQLLASVLSFGVSILLVFVFPFFHAGLVGMIDEGLDGRTSFDRFLQDGKEYYVSVLVVVLLMFGLNVVFGIAVFVAVLFGAVTVAVEASTAVLAIVAVIGLLGLAAYIAVVFFVQFYGQAIVIDEQGAIDGITRSAGLVRRNLLSVFGYSLLLAVVGGLFGLAYGVVFMLISPGTAALFEFSEPSTAAIVGAFALFVVGGTLFSGFLTTYAVAFYRELIEAENRTL